MINDYREILSSRTYVFGKRRAASFLTWGVFLKNLWKHVSKFYVYHNHSFAEHLRLLWFLGFLMHNNSWSWFGSSPPWPNWISSASIGKLTFLTQGTWTAECSSTIIWPYVVPVFGSAKLTSPYVRSSFSPAQIFSWGPLLVITSIHPSPTVWTACQSHKQIKKWLSNRIGKYQCCCMLIFVDKSGFSFWAFLRLRLWKC